MKVGMIAYACKQGLGYLAKSFYDAGVIDSVIQIKHRHHTNYDWYKDPIVFDKMPIVGRRVEDFLYEMDLVLCFETPFDWTFPLRCRRAGVKTICMPMYEWFPKDKVDVFDYYLSPSQLDMEYFPGSFFFQPPVDPSTWKLRTTATTFVHNAGNVGSRNHKGTEELLAAIPFIKSDISLIIRAQNTDALGRLLDKYPIDSRVTVTLGEIEYSELFATGDVYVAPEKYNGLSLPLQEAYAAGMLVVTTNRYPTNTWLPNEPLIPVESVHRASISPSYFDFDECVVNPKTIAETIDAWYGKDITEYSLQAKAWAESNSWAAKKATLTEIFNDCV